MKSITLAEFERRIRVDLNVIPLFNYKGATLYATLDNDGEPIDNPRYFVYGRRPPRSVSEHPSYDAAMEELGRR